MGHLALDFSSLSTEMETIGDSLICSMGPEFSHGLEVLDACLPPQKGSFRPDTLMEERLHKP